MKKKTILLLTNLILVLNCENVASGTEEIDSPYEACKNISIVNQLKKQQNNENIGADCKTKSNQQFFEDMSLMALDPLNEGAKYLTFAGLVTEEVIKNYKKNNRYLVCSALCFSGEKTCPKNTSEDEKTVDCNERKNEIKNGMQGYTKKIRMELALSKNSSKLITADQANILTIKPNELVNKDLSDFEIGTPNPLGFNPLTDEEFKEALKISKTEREKIETEFKNNNFKYNSKRDWISHQIIENYEEHRSRYRGLIYDEVPLFAIIGTPIKKGPEPLWTDSQFSKAFFTLSKNATDAISKAKWSLKNSKLEFSRLSGEAMWKSLASIFNIVGQNDLLFYTGMKNQVEEVLRKDPSYCAVATMMEARLRNKNLQNSTGTVLALIAGPFIAKGPVRLFKIGRVVFGEEAASIAGISLGSYFIGDSFRQFNAVKSEALTRSGLGGKNEGLSNVTGNQVELARNNIKLLLAFVPLDFPEIKILINKILVISHSRNKKSWMPLLTAKQELEHALHQWEITDAKLFAMSGVPSQLMHEIEILINPVKETYKYNSSVLAPVLENSKESNKKKHNENQKKP